MSKTGFFRTRQGGRFKKDDQGDLGLRAYKEQQDTIIQALKEQKQSVLAYRDSTERGLEDVGRNQLQNLSILNDLRNQKYQTRRSAIEVAKKTELTKISDQAKIFGDKAKWMQEWAPTFYQNVFKAGVATEELYSKYTADRDYAELVKNPKYQTALNELDLIDEETSSETFKAIQNAYTNKDEKGTDYLIGLRENSNRFLSEKITADIIERFDGIESDLQRFITNTGEGRDPIGEWNAETVPEYYRMRARELIRMFGITGKSATKLLNHFETKGAIKSSELADYDRLKKDTEIRRTTAINTATLYSTSDGKQQVNVGTHNFLKHNYRQTERGEIFNNANAHDAHKMHFSEVIATGKVTDFEELKSAFLDSCILGESGDSCTTWRQKHKGLESELDDVIIIAKAALAEKATNKQKGDDGFALETWRNKFNSTGIYAKGGEKEGQGLNGSISNVAEFDVALTDFRTAVSNGHTETANFIGKYLHLKPGSVSMDSRLEAFQRSALTLDYPAMMDSWAAMPQAMRDRPEIANLFKRATILRDGGLSPEKLTTFSTELLKNYSFTSSWLGGKTITPSAKALVDGGIVQDVFFKNFNTLLDTNKYDINDPSTYNSLIEAAKIITKEQVESNTGYFKVRDDGKGGLTFVFGELTSGHDTDSNIEANFNDIKQAITNTNGDLNHDSLYSVIRPIDLKPSIQNYLGGYPVRLPDSVHILYEMSDKSISKRDYINRLFKYHGFGPESSSTDDPNKNSYQLNEGVEDFVDKKIEALWGGKTQETWQSGNSPFKTPKTISFGKWKGKDAIVLNTYADIVNQMERVPMNSWNQTHDLAAALDMDFPGIDTSGIIFNADNGTIQLPFGDAWKEVIRNRKKYGIDMFIDDNGALQFKYIRPPAPILNREQGLPPDRTPSTNIREEEL